MGAPLQHIRKSGLFFFEDGGCHIAQYVHLNCFIHVQHSGRGQFNSSEIRTLIFLPVFGGGGGGQILTYCIEATTYKKLKSEMVTECPPQNNGKKWVPRLRLRLRHIFI